jgi:hypothetical protein
VDALPRNDRRDNERYRARVFIKIHAVSGKYLGMVDDISKTGISVMMHDTAGLRPHDSIEVHSEKLGAIEGHIRWVQKKYIGVEFERSTNNSAKIAAFFRSM